MSFHPEAISKPQHIDSFKSEILKSPNISLLSFTYFGLCHSKEEINLVWQKMLGEKLVKRGEIESIVEISNIHGIGLKAPIVIKLVDKIKEYVSNGL